MPRKKKENSEVTVYKKKWVAPGEEKRVGVSTDLGPPENKINVVTTSADRPPRGRGKALTTRSLPDELPNYHKKGE